MLIVPILSLWRQLLSPQSEPQAHSGVNRNPVKLMAIALRLEFYLLVHGAYVTRITVRSDIVHILLRCKQRKMQLVESMVQGRKVRCDSGAGDF
jgi:hypothetical protein